MDTLAVAEIYRTFSQSILLYGFEIWNYSKTKMNELKVRQNILVKNTIGLPKLSKKTPLFVSLNIKSIQHLLYQHKLAFLMQLYKVDYTKIIYYYLEHNYEDNIALTESFFIHTVLHKNIDA